MAVPRSLESADEQRIEMHKFRAVSCPISIDDDDGSIPGGSGDNGPDKICVWKGDDSNLAVPADRDFVQTNTGFVGTIGNSGWIPALGTYTWTSSSLCSSCTTIPVYAGVETRGWTITIVWKNRADKQMTG